MRKLVVMIYECDEEQAEGLARLLHWYDKLQISECDYGHQELVFLDIVSGKSPNA